MKPRTTLLCVSLLVPALALAQPRDADGWYKEGETQYNLGNFEKAADAFKQGFALETSDSKKPAYLYNVAQAYRQDNKCKDAAFFYKRYLSLKDQDTVKPLKPDTRAEIDQRITELEECAKNQDAIAKKPPDNTIRLEGDGAGSAKLGTTKLGTGTGSGTAGTGSGEAATGAGSGSATRVAHGGDEEASDEGEPSVTKGVTSTPKLFSARIVGGGSKISAGSLEFPIQATFGLIGGYPLILNDKLELDLGVAFSYTPISYTNTLTQASRLASFTTALANAGATYAVAPKFGVRADVGIGALFFAGIDEMGNPFTAQGAPTTGALTMLAVRAGVSADYAITPNLIATVAPIAFTYSPPKAGLRDDIKSITRLDFMLGIGYRM